MLWPAFAPWMVPIRYLPAPRWIGIVLLLALSLLAGLRSAAGTQLDSFTMDEPWHVVAGTAYVRGEGFHLNPEHPPLVKLWVGAWMPESFHLPPPAVLHEKEQERDWVENVMFFGNDARAAQARARLSLWTLHGSMLALLGLLLWRAFGLAWACGTLLFLALEPTVGAHLPVVMTDLPLALSLAIAALCAGLLATTWHWRWAIGCGLAMGVALAAKHSALAGLAGLGIGLVIAALCGWRQGGRAILRRAMQLAVAVLLSVTVLWSMYGLHFHAGADGRDAFNRRSPPRSMNSPCRTGATPSPSPMSTSCCRVPICGAWPTPSAPGWKAAASACTRSGARPTTATRRGSAGRRSWRRNCRSR
jgi:hypothetical protein